MGLGSNTSQNATERPLIGCRWWSTGTGEVHVGWPHPYATDETNAMGWVAADAPLGVIESCEIGVTKGLLDALEARFPGRRWYEGQWSDDTGPDPVSGRFGDARSSGRAAA